VSNIWWWLAAVVELAVMQQPMVEVVAELADIEQRR
jgi:hypothetical protein